MRKKHRKTFNYFEAFEKMAKYARKEAKLLKDTIEDYDPDKIIEVMDKAHEIEHSSDMVSHEIFTAIARDFMPPIEREDIIELCSSLDNITDLIEGVIQRFYMFDIDEMHDEALGFAKLVDKCCEALERALKDFESFKRSNIRERVIEINSYEEEADNVFVGVIRHLHVNHKDEPLTLITWSQIFGRMEQCTDACEHVADVMNSIAIKNA